MERFFSLILIILAALINTSFASSSDYAIYPKTRLGARQEFFSGEKYKSLSETGSGVSAGISVFTDGAHFVPFFGFYVSSAVGSQVFMDGTTAVSTGFKFYSASTEIGMQIYPIERRESGFNIYIVGAGTLGYNFIALSKSTSLATLPYSDQSFSNGYYSGIGSELIFGSDGLSKWTLNSEVLLKKESGTLLKQQFDFSCLIFAVGLGW